MKGFLSIFLLAFALLLLTSVAQEPVPESELDPEMEPDMELDGDVDIIDLVDECILSRERCLLICDAVKAIMYFDCEEKSGAFSSSCACGTVSGAASSTTSGGN
eukprot:TRINITY_DN7734_c0_g1_i1.p4 TRINITY_DN7734_c0_g1~~TRINITY_DN7734_c0_g1_i1.p4  ORF type:complete len:104 (+),score=22.50 TRINITY_DN7734_c0_g1_i1:114-425(+)